MRFDWAGFTRLEEIPVKAEAEIAYFVGCTTAFKGVDHDIAYATGQLLNHLEEDWTLLSEDEWCCGGPLVMASDEEKAKEFAEHNIEEIERRGVEILLMGCPSCYRMWKFEVPEILGRELNFTVKHSVQHILQRINEGKVTPSASDKKLTYHDPCELSRLGGVMDEPREILKAFSSAFVEMPEHGMGIRCCGGCLLSLRVNEDWLEAEAEVLVSDDEPGLVNAVEAERRRLCILHAVKYLLFTL